jgi:hypothetical protein
LDLVITNCHEKVLEIREVGRLGRSDHCMLSIIMEAEPSRTGEERTGYAWNKTDMEAIRSDLDGMDWNREIEVRSVEEAWNFITHTLNESIERNVPKGKPRVRFKHPWMTREILQLVRKKRRFWRTYRSASSLQEREAYMRVEKETSKKIRNAKRKLDKDLVSNADKNNQKFTKYMKSKTKSKTTIGPLITKEKTVLSENKEMADELNRFFSSVFTQEDLTSIPAAEQEPNMQRMEPVTVNEADILCKIRKLRKDAAPVPDRISPKILQQLEKSFLVPLKLLFNITLIAGKVPSEWKTATVTPIFKKGTKGDPGNYRPVSLTSVPCKLLESVIKDKIMSHLLNNELIKDSQHGFMPGRSCSTNLVHGRGHKGRRRGRGSGHLLPGLGKGF